MTRSARPARRVGCVSNLPSRHRRDTIRAQADAAKKAKAHASKKGKKAVSKRVYRVPNYSRDRRIRIIATYAQARAEEEENVRLGRGERRLRRRLGGRLGSQTEEKSSGQKSASEAEARREAAASAEGRARESQSSAEGESRGQAQS